MTEDNIKAGWNFKNSYTSLPDIFFTAINVNPVNNPTLILLNKKLTTSLGLNDKALESRYGVEELAGNHVLEGGISLAQAYAGHQFGNFNMLGDGRALLRSEERRVGKECPV